MLVLTVIGLCLGFAVLVVSPLASRLVLPLLGFLCISLGATVRIVRASGAESSCLFVPVCLKCIMLHDSGSTTSQSPHTNVQILSPPVLACCVVVVVVVLSSRCVNWQNPQ